MKEEALKLLRYLCSSPEPRHGKMKEIITKMGFPFLSLKNGPFEHFYLPGAGKKAQKLLVAHFDRVPGTAGANDNTASLVHLLLFRKSFQNKDQSSMPHILFSDGEELTTHGQSQGLCGLLETSFRSIVEKSKIFVLDMTGKGDTLILGKGPRKLLEDSDLFKGNLKEALENNRRWAKQLLGKFAPTNYMELPTPFSDDLAFLEKGLPAIQISLLPFKEAQKAKKEGLKQRPKSWQSMHTPEDRPENLDMHSFVLMEGFLKEITIFPFR